MHVDPNSVMCTKQIVNEQDLERYSRCYSWSSYICKKVSINLYLKRVEMNKI